MNLKNDLTKYVAEQLGLSTEEKSLKKLTPVWWQNPRNKSKGGLRLTEKGFECLQQADIKAHKVRFEEPVHYTNQLIIWLDNFIDCPWYVTNKEIYVFGEKMAVQLVLFSGNIAKFSAAKANKLKST
jgi:hypothetical protein